MMVQMSSAAPDLSIGGFSLWIHGWERDEAGNLDDLNWLVMSARHQSAGTTVLVGNTSILQSMDLVRFLSALECLYESLSGEAVLEGHESQLKVVLRASPQGSIEMVVDITPDVINEEHRFRTIIDQSYLPETIANLKRILLTYAPRSR
jgi:hypothetical protein